MAFQGQTLGGVKVYHLTSGKSSPQWLEYAKKEKKGLRYDDDFRSRVEFIQDYEFPCRSNRVQITKNGEFLIATGVYPPSVKVFQLDQLAMYFERRFDNEIIDFIMLEDDWKKMAFLRADRYIEFHSRFGLHEKIRCPKFGRTMTYNKWSCELYITCADPEVMRLNLEQGQFFAPLKTNIPDVLCSAMNPVFDILAFGGADCLLELWDSKEHVRSATIDVSEVADLDITDTSVELTTLEFNIDGLTLACGTSTGQIVFFDIRSRRPIKILDHRYELPIHRICFDNDFKKIYTCDSKIVKIWNSETYTLFSSITPEPAIHDICLCPGTGISFLAVEDQRAQAYFIPSIGPAPSWCPMLENMTEELEEKKEKVVYTDYKFLTRDQLRDLGLDNLIGSGLLKAYMHGFYIHTKFYNQVKQVTTTETYERFIKDKTKRLIEKKRARKITNERSMKKFNKELYSALASKQVRNLGRFSAVFDDDSFKIDKESEEFHRATDGGRKNILREENRDPNFDDADGILGNFDQIEEEESSDDGPKMFSLKPGYIGEQIQG